MQHHYQSWFSEYLHMTPWRWAVALAVALAAASLSLLKPEFFRQLIGETARGTWRWAAARIPSLGRAEQGITIAGNFIADSARLLHTFLQGTTGTGKSVLMELMSRLDMARGHGMMIIDPKGDRQSYERARAYCREIGREDDLYYLSATHPQESVRWNPCRLGNPSELQSKWFNSGAYKEPFYAGACELGLIQAFNALTQELPEGFTLSELVAQVEEQAKASDNDHMRGLFQELYNFSLGEWGPLLCAPQPGVAEAGTREISLFEIIQKDKILFVDLPTEGKSLQSGRVGRLLLQELIVVSGMRKSFPSIMSKRPFSVYVDEFDAFASETFTMFLNKGRSANFMIHMAYQTLSDLKKVSETFAGQVLGLCNVGFTFRMNNPDDCDFMARFYGTKRVVKKTYQTENGIASGRSSNRETQEFNVHPDEIKRLQLGKCIFSMKAENALKTLRVPAPAKSPKPPTHSPVERGLWRGGPPAKTKGPDQVAKVQAGLLLRDTAQQGTAPAPVPTSDAAQNGSAPVPTSGTVPNGTAPALAVPPRPPEGETVKGDNPL